MEEYVPPTLTIDAVVFQLIDDELCVLLIKRKNEPFKDMYALPGGYNAAGQTTTEAMEDILARKTGVKASALRYVEQLYTFDSIARDPRGHAVAVTYMALGRNIAVLESSETHRPQFMPVNNLPKLSYDHADIIRYAHDRLASKITYTNAVSFMLPNAFTLSELQAAYEAIFNRELDKRNFRKKFLSLDMIEETGEMSTGAAHRPARLYRFKRKTLQTLLRSFD